MPSPADLGLPPKFREWRKGQEKAFEQIQYARTRFAILNSPVGQGKCHAPGQGILMADGRTKRVEDVEIGDLLLGASSKPREVLSLAHGEDEMFDIVPVKGVPWRVNGNHILTLVHTESNATKDVSVRTWLSWKPWWRNMWKLFRVAVPAFRIDQRGLPLDPYFLGIMLGDGAWRGQPFIAKPDKEIRDEVYRQAAIHGATIRETTNSTGCPHYFFVGRGSGQTNPVMRAIRELGLGETHSGTKFVPDVYKMGTWQQRRAVLAGLMDTDGSLANNGYDYISKSKQLADDVVFIARSLGLGAYVTECRKGCQNGFVGTYHRVNIHGDTDSIPCRIPRKQAAPRLQKKDPLRTGFKVVPVGRGEYFGFMLDGDGRYLLDDFTITHNSMTSIATALVDAFDDDDPRRTAYLTANHHLQKQVLEDFEVVGVTDIRGRTNYVCNIDESRTAANAKCTAGIWCERSKGKGGPCDYYDQRKDAAAANITLTNYAYWLHDEETQQLGKYHRLILDEAHQALPQLEKFAAVEITDREILEYGGKIPRKGEGQGRWKIAMLDTVQRVVADRRPRPGDKLDWKYLEWARRGKDLMRRLTRLCRLSAQEWLCSRVGKTWRWELLNAGALAEPLLFRGAARVVLVSATVNRKTLELLGVRDPNIKLVEQDSTFPVARRPIYYWPVVRVSHGMDAVDKKRWIEAIDAIIEPRQDRKGLIHSVSYARALEIVAASRHKGLFLVHRQGTKLAQVVEEFKKRKAPCILITPAASEGVDLPMQDCEYVIIPKMPFPDMRDPLIKAKKSRDKDYIPYIVLQTVVQSVGRGMRSRDDMCECWIIDSHFQWLKGGYHHYLPRWFQVALRTLPQRQPPPAPLPKLTS